MTLIKNRKQAAFTIEGYMSHLKRTNFKELAVKNWQFQQKLKIL